MDFDGTQLAALVVGAGALGAAASGIVDGLKWLSPEVSTAGFDKLEEALGRPLVGVLGYAYGAETRTLLRAQYRQGRRKGDLPRTLRQGVRIGLAGAEPDELAAELPGVDAGALGRAAAALAAGKVPKDTDRPSLARFEMAVDARIDAALALAEEEYKGVARVAATGIAIAIAVVVGLLNAGAGEHFDWGVVGLAVLVGVAAVPVAPIAKDLSSAINAADKAVRRRA